MASFALKKSYNFSTLAPTILGNEYENMKVKAILDSDGALKYRDIATLHQTIKGVMTNLPSSITDLTYILFVNQNDEELVLALEYINTDSIKEVASVNIRIDVMNTNTEDIAILTSRLKELGYINFTITTFQ